MMGTESLIKSFEELFHRLQLQHGGGELQYNVFSDDQYEFFLIRHRKKEPMASSSTEAPLEAPTKDKIIVSKVDPALFQPIKKTLPKDLKCIIQLVLPDRVEGPLLYVMPDSKNDLCLKILKRLNRNVERLQQVSVDEISTGGMYVAQWQNDNLYYRVVVLDKRPTPDGGNVLGRLCEYGDVDLFPVSTFRRLDDKLEKISALAFPVALVNAEEKLEGFKIGDRIAVQFEEEEGAEIGPIRKARFVQTESEPEKPKTIKINVVSYLSDKLYIVKFPRAETEEEDEKTLLKDIPADAIVEETPKASDLVIVDTENMGKQRAQVIQSVQNQLILYYLDIGCIRLTSGPFFKYPDSLKKLKPLAMLMKLADADAEVYGLLQWRKDFNLIVQKTDETQSTYAGILEVGPEKKIPATFQPFVGELDTLGLEFWRQPAESESSIIVTGIDPNNPVKWNIVSEEDITKYQQILCDSSPDYKPLSSPPKRGQVVMQHVTVDSKNNYWTRLLVVQGPKEKEEDILLMDLDTGDYYVSSPPKELLESTEIVRNLPVHVMSIELTDLPDLALDHLDLLKRYVERQIESCEEFKVIYNGCFIRHVKLETMDHKSVGGNILRYINRKLGEDMTMDDCSKEI